MGMGTAPISSFVISLDNLRSICPEEVAACETAFAHEDQYSWGEYAFDLAMETEIPNDIENAVNALIAAFEQKTTVNNSRLTLGIGYYSEEEGDTYDNLSHTEGCYFEVDGMVDFTDAGNKFKDVIKTEAWTQYG